jgi:predicted transport protein
MCRGKLYHWSNFKNEEELEKLVQENANLLFGQHALYFPVKKRLESKFKERVTDGLLLDLSEPPRFWIVEVELSRHDLEQEVEPQIRGFLRAFEKEESISQILSVIYERVQSDSEIKRRIRERIGSDGDIHHFLSQILHEKSGVLVVIDDLTEEIQGLSEEWSRLYGEVRVLEVQQFTSGKELAISFTPLTWAKVAIKAPARPWNESYNWCLPETRDLVEQLKDQIGRFPDILHEPNYKWYYFYKGKKDKRSNLFAVLLLQKKSVQVRFQVDSKSFSDSKNLSKLYKGWFFKVPGMQERGVTIVSLDDVPYVLKLVQHSYDLR